MFFGRLTIGPLGELRSRATLLAPVETADEIGGVTRSFIPSGSLWCHLEPVLGYEQFDSGRRGETVSHRISMRFRSDVAAQMRLSIGARLFEIEATADPDGRRRRLIVLAQEVKP